jgi:hypothetical protein
MWYFALKRRSVNLEILAIAVQNWNRNIDEIRNRYSSEHNSRGKYCGYK